MSLVVVIPAYNAGAHVEGVLQRLAGVVGCELSRVIVVDDGSVDDTAQRVRASGFDRAPLTLIQRQSNGGYGAAMKDGLEAARAESPSAVACIHADGQYSPEELPALCRARARRGLDLLQGSRIASGTALAGGMPLYKYVANALLNRVENHTLELGMSDYHSGYLVYGSAALGLPFRSLSDSFDFDLEVIASARARGLSVGEEPIRTHYGDEVSHLNPLTYGLRALRVMWNYRRGNYAAS
ncbi:MAG: glycosyltransferase family 2 protein [Myxococcales bacterium]|nr:MAG: glycosyltransferase family 2 protein [Myxococcales bacterium]